MRHAGWAMASIAGLVALPGVALAQSETTASADIDGSTGYSSNPFAGTGGGSGYAQLRVRPTVQIRSEKDDLTLSGEALVQQYFRRYGTRDNYNAKLNYVGQRSERLTLTTNASYTNAISGSSFSGLDAGDVTDPELPDAATDLDLFGTGNRRQTVNGRMGATMRLSAVDRVNGYATVISTTNSRSNLAADYRGYGGGVGYLRQLNETISLGVTGFANTNSYTRNGRTTVYGGEGSFDIRFNERLSLSGSIGVSHIDGSSRSLLVGGIGTQTVLSGHASLCRRNPAGQLCLGLSRAILPSSIGGARVQSVVDASYQAKLSERASITARSAFTDASGSGSGAFSSIRYWSNTVGYQHILGERLSLSANANYRTVNGGARRRPDDVGGSLGLSYAIGRSR